MTNKKHLPPVELWTPRRVIDGLRGGRADDAIHTAAIGIISRYDKLIQGGLYFPVGVPLTDMAEMRAMASRRNLILETGNEHFLTLSEQAMLIRVAAAIVKQVFPGRD